jgi:anti-sigma regulatory factor (Ser/Thr protein kinase)
VCRGNVASPDLLARTEVPTQQVVTLPPDTESPRRARHFVRELLIEDNISDTLEIVTLLVSEVVTNAVLHARSEVTVSVRRDGHAVHVEVADRSSSAPIPQSVTPDSTTGRGMHLVEELADAWGTKSAPDGKIVWFECAGAA